MNSPADTPMKKSKGAYSLPEDLLAIVKLDELNEKVWKELTKEVESYQVRGSAHALLFALKCQRLNTETMK